MSSNKIKDRASSIPTNCTIVKSPDQAERDLRAKTGPGQMMEFLNRESAALLENKDLKAEIAAIKSSEISLSSIVEVEGRRRKLSADKYAELVENLRHNKLAVPITLRSIGAGKFEIVSGHNRFHAFKDLGRESIPAAVVAFDDVEVIKGSFYANLISDTLPDYEKYKGFKQVMMVTGQTQAEVAKEAGVTQATVSRIMLFDTLPKAAIELIERQPDRVSYEALYKLNKHPRMMDGIKALIETNASLADAVAIATAKVNSTAARPTPVIIKSGSRGAHIAEMVNRSGVISIKFKDPDLAARLAPEFEAIIRKSQG